MVKKNLISDFPAVQHDHDACRDKAMEKAEAICRERGERFTDLRREILELVWGTHHQVKAYDLLETISTNGRRGSPPTVYRALDFLQSNGLVHKLESINAYVGCADPGRHHSGQFLICVQCGAVAEMDDSTVSTKIAGNAKKLDFEISEQKIEVSGRCADCRA
ncbi:MAG: Fur family transcriptional regulator [Pseudomonadota bacterium]